MGLLSWLGQSSTRLLASASGPTIATYKFTFGRSHCHISADLDTSRFDHDKLLVVSYIAFLFRYFSLCDANQIRPVSDYLLANLGDDPDSLPREYSAHSVSLHQTLMKTYGHAVQKAAEQVFGGVPPGFEGYSSVAVRPEDARVPHLAGRLGTYTLGVTTDFVPLFDMTTGPQSVELPQMVLLFYAYVVENLHDEPKVKSALDEFVRQQIASHSRWDPTSPATMSQGTKKLIEDVMRRESPPMIQSDLPRRIEELQAQIEELERRAERVEELEGEVKNLEAEVEERGGQTRRGRLL